MLKAVANCVKVNVSLCVFDYAGYSSWCRAHQRRTRWSSCTKTLFTLFEIRSAIDRLLSASCCRQNTPVSGSFKQLLIKLYFVSSVWRSLNFAGSYNV